uniref:Attacin C-terminal domain-containing protein n=1 Tax=Glossina brevipalpis TaxID=37001 RepID=A0A1A9W309_9MUSC
MQSFKIGLFISCLSIALVKGQLSGTASSNPNGGLDVNARLSKAIGDPNSNVVGGVFAAGNTDGGPSSRGAFLGVNKDGHGLGLQHTKTDNFGSTLTSSARANLFNDQTHKVDANAFHSRTHLDNGFKFDRVGGGLGYEHANGHGASLTGSRIPQLGMNTFDLGGKANLWSSSNRATTLDLTGGVSKHFGGPFDGQTNKHIGLGLNSRF